MEQFQLIACTKDNLKGQAKKFGKSISEASIGQLRTFLAYKSLNSGRQYLEVPSQKSTLTCSKCEAQTGPTGWDGLAVRFWECQACGAKLDRDVNAALNTLKTALGWSVENAGIHAQTGREAPDWNSQL